MKITMRTNPDRSGRETTFKEEKVILTGGVLAQITSLLDLANSEFQKYAQNDKENDGRSRWDWWGAICQTTWAEIKFFTEPGGDVDESFNLWLKLNFPIVDGEHSAELGLELSLSHQVGLGGANFPSLDIWHEQDRKQELFIERHPKIPKKLNPDTLIIEAKSYPFLKTLADQDLLYCISLLLASLETQVREVSQKFSRKAFSQTAP